MQLQELLSVAQGSTLRVAKLFFKENPDIMQKYVDTSITAIGLVLNPLNAFMKHLLVIQGVDPNTTPGEKARQAFLDSLTDSIPEHHALNFDDDYEFGAFHQSLLETREKLAKLGLTKDKFRQLTDLTKMPGGFKNKYSPFLIDRAESIDSEDDFFGTQTELNRVAPEVLPKKELPLDKAGRQALREKVLKDIAAVIRSEKVASTFDPIADLKSALVESSPKKPIKVSKKNVNKNPKFKTTSTRMTVKKKEPTTDPKFKGSFWRVNEEAE